jgi:hypothetical protein
MVLWEYVPKNASTYNVEAEIQRWNDFNALSTAEKDTLDPTAKEYGVQQPLMMANIGTKAISQSKFERFRDMMMNGNQCEDDQREHSGESKEAIGPEQSQGQSVIEVTNFKCRRK